MSGRPPTVGSIRTQREVADMLGITNRAVASTEDRALRKMLAALEADPQLRALWDAMTESPRCVARRRLVAVRG